MSKMIEDVVTLNIELGHRADFRPKPSPEGFTHDWTVFVRGPDGAKIHHYVEKVVFHLHDTFKNPKRVITEPPYEVSESGYAGFLLPIEIYFKNKQPPRKISFQYDLFLNGEGAPAVRNLRCEKLKFANPTEDFRQKLLKAGAVSSSANNSSGPVGSQPFTELFGPPIKTPFVDSPKKSKTKEREKGSKGKSNTSPTSSSSEREVKVDNFQISSSTQGKDIANMNSSQKDSVISSKESSSYRDSTSSHKDSTSSHKDSTSLHKDSTFSHRDTTSSQKDSTASYKETSHKDLHLSHKDTFIHKEKDASILTKEKDSSHQKDKDITATLLKDSSSSNREKEKDSSTSHREREKDSSTSHREKDTSTSSSHKDKGGSSSQKDSFKKGSSGSSSKHKDGAPTNSSSTSLSISTLVSQKSSSHKQKHKDSSGSSNTKTASGKEISVIKEPSSVSQNEGISSKKSSKEKSSKDRDNPLHRKSTEPSPSGDNVPAKIKQPTLGSSHKSSKSEHMKSSDDSGAKSLKSFEDNVSKSFKSSEDNGSKSFKSSEDNGSKSFRPSEDTGSKSFKTSDDAGAKSSIKSETSKHHKHHKKSDSKKDGSSSKVLNESETKLSSVASNKTKNVPVTAVISKRIEGKTKPAATFHRHRSSSISSLSSIVSTDSSLKFTDDDDEVQGPDISSLMADLRSDSDDNCKVENKVAKSKVRSPQSQPVIIPSLSSSSSKSSKSAPLSHSSKNKSSSSTSSQQGRKSSSTKTKESATISEKSKVTSLKKEKTKEETKRTEPKSEAVTEKPIKPAKVSQGKSIDVENTSSITKKAADKTIQKPAVSKSSKSHKESSEEEGEIPSTSSSSSEHEDDGEKNEDIISVTNDELKESTNISNVISDVSYFCSEPLMNGDDSIAKVATPQQNGCQFFADDLADNGYTLLSLLKLQEDIGRINNPDALQDIAELIHLSGKFRISDGHFEFDLCLIEKEYVDKIKGIIAKEFR